jgi:hypothetical protein
MTGDDGELRLDDLLGAGPREPVRPSWEDDGPRGCVEFSGEPSDCP